MGVSPRRVFLSHTSELREYPEGGSFVDAMEKAVLRGRDAPVDMAHFTAGVLTPAASCRERVAECDVYLLVAGFRYGSPVVDRPSLSYTELEFEAATELGKPRLVFLLDQQAEGPGVLFLDPEFGDRQEAFRRRLMLDSGLIVKTVRTPAELDAVVVQALAELRTATTALPDFAVTTGRGASPGGVPVWKVPARLQGFAGREELLEELSESLDAGPVVVRAIEGMGGVGKSSTAIEYAHRHAAGYDVVWWIAAENPDLIPQQLAELGQALRLTEPSEPVGAAVPRVLGELRNRERVLLVFDNAEHPQALAPYLPGGQVRVLITSRYPFWAGVAVPVSIDVFIPEESARFLAARAPHLTADEIAEVTRTLGHLPSALDQAAALLADSTLTPANYLSLLDSRARDLLHRGVTLGADGDTAMPVAASWSLAFDALAQRDPAALQLLTLLAWLAPEPVPLTLITGHPDVLPEPLAAVATDPLRMADTMRLLRERALARVDADSLLLHRIPAALLRTGPDDARHPQATTHGSGWPVTAALVLRRGLPENSWNNPAVWPQWHRLLPHLLTTTAPDRHDLLATHCDTLINLLSGISNYLETSGQPRQALPHAQRAHRLAHDHHGPDHTTTFNSNTRLALRLSALGEYQAARELDEDTLNRQRRVLGDDHPNTLISANNLAINLRGLGEYQAARELDEDTLNRRRRVLGENHPDTLSSANNLAINLRKLAKHQAARELDEDTLARRRRVLGDDHPNTLNSANNLAINLRKLGKHQAARELNEDTLNRRRRVLGENHPGTLRSANNLAIHLRELGDCGAARELNEDTLNRRRRVLGENHPNTLRTARNLVVVLRDLAQDDQADALQAWIAHATKLQPRQPDAN
ncbi:FxSxx-COOH system tetratricopeptide repeat protein [Lentzea sp. BCCO 10_0856]|uniref:FxSxx-COOH system tetratricopeptide repeat protein n=1 Tax=Lentzea miocenica TaxID=3095431 RepID=A0ABU4T7T9_9PSEU|nr:FxSxx-COOH system tetratricopeptide repeat protein [Lentzea sp. BCCO 10_0856]MDX8034233.1 FxSxx-COOH system tetratricopeptide repeat protein [Lentzea sp. BCCO 10_0856]